MWPNEYDYDPGDAIGFDAKYLATVAKVFAQLDSMNTLMLHCSKPNRPVELSGTAFVCNNDVPFEILLMPKLLRDQQRSDVIAERLVERFNAKPEADREGIRAAFGTNGNAVNFLKDESIYFGAQTISQAAAISKFIAGE